MPGVLVVKGLDKAIVSIVKVTDVPQAVKTAVELIGEFKGIIDKGVVVLVKPNAKIKPQLGMV